MLDLCFLVVLILVIVTPVIVPGRPIKVKAGVILTQGGKTAYDYDVIKPALRAAYDSALLRYNVQFEEHLCLYSKECSTSNAVGETYICGVINKVDVVIGPACTLDMLSSLELLSYLMIPSVTGAGNLVDNLGKFPYASRLAYNTYTQWGFLIKMCSSFNWTNVAIIFNRDDSTQTTNAQSLVQNLLDFSIIPHELSFSGNNVKSYESAVPFLVNASFTSRVVVYLMDSSIIRSFMIAAHTLEFTDGDYVFFALDLFRDGCLSTDGWKKDDTFDKQAMEAYQSLLVLTIRDNSHTEVYQRFLDTLNETAARDFPEMTAVANYILFSTKHENRDTAVNEAIGAARKKKCAVITAVACSDNDPVNSPVNHIFKRRILLYSSTNYVVSFYDAVMMYALSISRTSQRGQSTNPQQNINNLSQVVWGDSFEGATGSVYMDSNGDKSEDFSLYGFSATGEIFLIANYFSYKTFSNKAYKFDQIVPFRWLNPLNSPPINEPKCGYLGNKPICDTSAQTLGMTLGIVGGLLVVFCISGSFLFQYFTRKAELIQLDVLASWQDITKPQIFLPKVNTKSGMEGSHISLQAKSMLNDINKMMNRTIMAVFKDTRVILRICEVSHMDMDSVVLKEIKMVRSVGSENLAALLGLCPGPQRAAVIYGYCAKGSLFDLIASSDVKLDWIFKFSLVKCVLNGLSEIALSGLMNHGRLTSKCCFVDAHFVAKIADYGLPSVFARTVPPTQDSAFCATLFWTAPEHLLNPFNSATQEGDVFSFAIILSELIMREAPYASYGLDPEVIIAKLQQKHYTMFRPKVDATECPPEMLVLMKQCWANNPLERPRLAQVKSAMKESERGNNEQGSILETLIRRMENHTLGLQNTVEEKANQFALEKEKSERLLYQILPRMVVDQLKRGEQVKPEDFDSVTVFYSDIVSFTTLSSMSTPSEVVDLLNDLYTIFDNCITKFDAYKVETIGDCYVVASGVPQRNGNRHAVEICRLSMMLLEQIKAFKIRHRPDEHLRLRLGAHTGPCVSGVVGLVMPRFCLFGETVTIAGKMESTSLPMYIQISAACEKVLQTLGKFETEPRDQPIRINENMEIRTFWLQREIP